MKRALWAAIARNMETVAIASPGNVFIFMPENDYSLWSVGCGLFEMAIARQRSVDSQDPKL